MLEFFKFEALGNDFMLVDAREQSFEPTSEKVRHLGDRRTGIGFDQLLILRPSEEATVQVDIHNQDGSVAEQCGNGMRAVALYLHEQGELVETASLATAGGQVQIEFETPDRITATLPPPAFAPPPGSPAARNENWTESHGGRNLGLNFVALGNPHLITELTDSADDLFFTAAGSTLSRHALLADGANVSFARVIDRSHVDLTVYERGVGLTRACGSGACATAVSLIERQRVDTTVNIDQPGGRLVIHWPGAGLGIRMTGPARRIYEGRIDLDPPSSDD